MGVSDEKKEKNRRSNEKRINKNCKNMIGCTVDYEQGYFVKDQAKINHVMYLLAQSKSGQYAIFKIVKLREYVQLSNKKVQELVEEFSNCENWYRHSAIQITPQGYIKAVKQTIQKISLANGKIIHTYIVIE